MQPVGLSRSLGRVMQCYPRASENSKPWNRRSRDHDPRGVVRCQCLQRCDKELSKSQMHASVVHRRNNNSRTTTFYSSQQRTVLPAQPSNNAGNSKKKEVSNISQSEVSKSSLVQANVDTQSSQKSLQEDAAEEHADAKQLEHASSSPVYSMPKTMTSGKGTHCEMEQSSSLDVPAHVSQARDASISSSNTQGVSIDVQRKLPSAVQSHAAPQPYLADSVKVGQREQSPPSSRVVGSAQQQGPSNEESLRHPGDLSTLVKYLQERGLSDLSAERLALELLGEDSQFADVAVLRQRLRELESLLPGADINWLVCKDAQVLNATVHRTARRLIFLDAKLGHPDLVQLVNTAPQLLYAEDLEERLEHCLAKLRSLLPTDYPLDSLQKLLVEAPTIIFRMDYYVDANHINDLPQDLVERLLHGQGQFDAACMI